MSWTDVKEKTRSGLLLLQKKYPDDVAAFCAWGCFFLLLLCFAVVEFSVNYATKCNLSFWNPFLQALPTFLALSAPVLLLGGIGSRIYIALLLVYILLMEGIGTAVLMRFKVEFEADLLLVALSSSWQEMTEFVGAYYGWIPVLFWGIFICALYGGGVYFFGRKRFRGSWRTRLAGVALLIPFAIVTVRYCYQGKRFKAFNRTCLTRVVNGFYDFSRQWSSLISACSHPQIPEMTVRVDAKIPVTGVLVIGESASRGHFGCYGYSRDTTPCMSKRKDVVLFDDVLSPWGSTTNALRCVLTQSTLEHFHDSKCSIVDVFKAAGYRVAVLSNQFRWGTPDTPITLMFRHADSILFLQESLRGGLDHRLLPFVDEELKVSEGKPLILIVHLIGSHSDAASRYPQDFGPFNGVRDAVTGQENDNTARNINEYDNSIAFTDCVLNELAERVAKISGPAFMLYFSDHGTVIDNGRDTLRSSRSLALSVYEIPFMVQFNDAYRRTFPETVKAAEQNRHCPFQTDRLFFGMACLANLKGDAVNEKENIFGAGYQPQAVRKIAGGKVPYPKDVR